MFKRFAIGFVAVLTLTLAGAATQAGGAKPEDVFKGRIIITKKRLPMHFSSAGAFIQETEPARAIFYVTAMAKIGRASCRERV